VAGQGAGVIAVHQLSRDRLLAKCEQVVAYRGLPWSCRLWAIGEQGGLPGVVVVRTVVSVQPGSPAVIHGLKLERDGSARVRRRSRRRSRHMRVLGSSGPTAAQTVDAAEDRKVRAGKLTVIFATLRVECGDISRGFGDDEPG
jgi:hypothetical protein